MADPLAAITSPVFPGACTYTGISVNGGAYTVGPGTYCGGISISNATVTLYPGLYVITGGYDNLRVHADRYRGDDVLYPGGRLKLRDGPGQVKFHSASLSAQ